MKKLIALLLVAAMVFAALSGCGGKDKTADASSDTGSGKLPTASDPSSTEPSLSELDTSFLTAVKGYIQHTMVTEYEVKSEDGFETTGENLIFLPKDSIISSSKDLLLHTYVKMDGGINLNTNLMRSLGMKVNGYNGEFKAGSFTVSSDCYLKISVKGKMSDIKISVPSGSEAKLFFGDFDSISSAPLAEKLGIAFSKLEASVNYLFISDVHHGSFVNDLNGDGKRDYDTLEQTASRLKTNKAKINDAVNIANISPYIDFIVIGGDIINGYETTESNTYMAAKKKNPKLTVSEHCIDQIQEILAPLKKCKKPVFVLAGNHDDNSAHNLWQENHPEGPKLYVDYLVSDLDWYEGVFKEFVNVKVVQDDGYTYAGKKLSKYYYYDLEKNGRTTRVICLDYNDDRFPFDSKGIVTSDASKGGYSKDQLAWLANTALTGDFNDCIMLSHAGASDVLLDILNAYQEEDDYRKVSLGINVDYEDRKSGDITHYHHGHEHEDFNTYSYDLDCWTLSTDSATLEAIAATPNSVYRYYVNTDTIKELTRSGSIK